MTLPPLGSRRFTAISFALAAVSLALYIQQFNRQDDYQFAGMVDLHVYRWGGMDVWHSTSNLYADQSLAALPFAYPPFAALVFSIASHLTMTMMKYAMTAVSVAALGCVGWTAWGWLGYRGARRAGLAAIAFALALWLEPVQQNLGFGQVNLVLLAVAFGDLALPDHRRFKGIGVGLATSIKLTPALFIVYLLLTRRFRAAAVATGTCVATIAVSFALLPGDALHYWGGGLLKDVVDQSFMPNQSLHGLILRLNLASGTLTHLLWDVALVVVVPAGLYLAHRAHRLGDEYGAVLICAFVTLLVSPISWTHHYVWMVPFLILAVHRCWLGGGKRRLWVPVALYGAFLAWPMRIDLTSGFWNAHDPLLATGLIWFLPHRGTGDLHWNAYQTVAGNYYVLVALIIALGWPTWQLWRERRAGRLHDGVGTELVTPARQDQSSYAATPSNG